MEHLLKYVQVVAMMMIIIIIIVHMLSKSLRVSTERRQLSSVKGIKGQAEMFRILWKFALVA